MAVENPLTEGDESTATSRPRTRAPKLDKPELVVKEAGEGKVEVRNPLERFMMPSFPTEEAFAEATASKQAAKIAHQAAGSKNAAKLIARAKEFVGTPYKWGGTSPLGFDCSGFTQFLYRELGINLPRVSYQQGNSGTRVAIKDLKPGDMVFWDTSSRNNGADHVAIYIGNGQVIHAPKPGDRVKISNLWNTGRAWGVAMNL